MSNFAQYSKRHSASFGGHTSRSLSGFPALTLAVLQVGERLFRSGCDSRRLAPSDSVTRFDPVAEGQKGQPSEALGRPFDCVAPSSWLVLSLGLCSSFGPRPGRFLGSFLLQQRQGVRGVEGVL